ncbi:PREDICTED: interleukin-1 beta-like [Cyprinodon variegatus]|nr:PREDICTED: interleukin-1 beta-like [Cyprinodon variegatus]
MLLNMQCEIIELSNSLDLMVTRNRKTMKGVANLVLALNKLSKFKFDRDLSNAQLCNTIMDCVMEEIVVEKGSSFCTEEKNFNYSRLVKHVELSDQYKKDLIQNSEEFRLQAITLKGGYCDLKVNFEMSCYRPATCYPNTGFTVHLSIRSNSKKLHLCCSKPDDKVLLFLKDCSDKCLSPDEQMQDSLFNKSMVCRDMATFESVKYPGWFISTAFEERDDSVEMCQADTAFRVTSFNFRFKD